MGDNHTRTGSTRTDSSTLNPAGTARRRLIKAVGLGAVASIVSIDWQKPSVRLGALPAHAQGSISCVLTYIVPATILPTGGGGGAISVTLIGSDTGGSFEFNSGVIFDQGEISGSTTTDGTDQLTLSMSASYTLGGQSLSISFFPQATCCFDAEGYGFQLSPEGTDGTHARETFTVDPDDGACNVFLPK